MFKQFINKGIKKLHLGCGGDYLNGYINIDFPEDQTAQRRARKPDIEADFTKLNYPDNTFEEIRLNHVFEHFQRHIALGLMCHWNRILIDNGLLKIAVPNIAECIRLFPSSNFKRKKELIRHMWGSHEAEWATHHEGWFDETLIEAYKICGFNNMTITKDGIQWPQIVIHGYKIADPDIQKIIDFLVPYDFGDGMLNKWTTHIMGSLR